MTKHCRSGENCRLHDCICLCDGCLPHSDPDLHESRSKDEVFERRLRESYLKFYRAITDLLPEHPVDEDEIFELIRALRARLGEANEALFGKPVDGPAWEYPIAKRLREERDHYRSRWHMVLNELDEQQKKNTELHRRAQRLEGIEAHMETLREKHRKELGDIFNRARFTGDLWFSRYREAVEVLRAAKVSDRIDGHDNYRTGNLIELIRRIIAERDDARELLRGVEKLSRERDESFGGKDWIALMGKIQAHREKIPR